MHTISRRCRASKSVTQVVRKKYESFRSHRFFPYHRFWGRLEFILNSVGYFGFWTYDLYTGDLETIRDVYPAVKRDLSLWNLGDD